MAIIEKIWGISSKGALKLASVGVNTIEDLADINVAEIASSAGLAESNLRIAQFIASKVSSDFVSKVGPKTLPISKKVYGVGADYGILLYALGVKDITDVTEDLQLNFPAKQEYFADKLNKIKSQVQLSLIPGLTSRQGYMLVGAGLTSLANLAGATPATIASRCNVPVDQANSWINMASKLNLSGILNYKKAGELLLAKKISGIGPEIGAILLCLGITSPAELLTKFTADIWSTYLPWVPKQEVASWFSQAFKSLHYQYPNQPLFNNFFTASRELCAAISKGDEPTGKKNALQSSVNEIKQYLTGKRVTVEAQMSNIVNFLHGYESELADVLKNNISAGKKAALQRVFPRAMSNIYRNIQEKGLDFFLDTLGQLPEAFVNKDAQKQMAKALLKTVTAGSEGVSNSMEINTSSIGGSWMPGDNEVESFRISESDDRYRLDGIILTRQGEAVQFLDCPDTTGPIIGLNYRNINFTINIPRSTADGSYQGSILVTAREADKNNQDFISDESSTVFLSIGVDRDLLNFTLVMIGVLILLLCLCIILIFIVPGPGTVAGVIGAVMMSTILAGYVTLVLSYF